MNEQISHPSKLILHQYVAGALDDKANNMALSHIQTCSRCTEIIEKMRIYDQKFLEKFPTLGSLPPKTEAKESTHIRVEESPPKIGIFFLKTFVAGLAVAAAIFAVVALQAVDLSKSQTFKQTERTKGSSIIELAISRNGGSFEYRGQPLLPGDILAFRYTTDYKYLLMLSVEKSGKTNIFIADNQQSLNITPGTKQRLKKSVQLDEYVGTEKIIALLTNEPLEVTTVQKSINERIKKISGSNLDDLPIGQLPFSGDQISWLIHKVR